MIEPASTLGCRMAPLLFSTNVAKWNPRDGFWTGSDGDLSDSSGDGVD
jgi:hypothetical protein